MPDQYEDLIKAPELLGIQTMGATEVVLRIVAETLPMRQTGMTRSIRKDIKLLLDEHGIKVPPPRFVMYPSGTNLAK
jgi:small conductance mechanosensitive channel